MPRSDSYRLESLSREAFYIVKGEEQAMVNKSQRPGRGLNGSEVKGARKSVLAQSLKFTSQMCRLEPDLLEGFYGGGEAKNTIS